MLIRKKLPLTSILIMFLSLLIMSSVYYAYISNILILNNKDKIHDILDLENVSLKTFFETRKIEIDYLSNDILVSDTINDYLENPLSSSVEFKPIYKALNDYFEQIVNTRDDIRDVFVLAPDGRVLASSEEKSYWIDLSDRQYYKDALEGKTTISNLLIDRVDGENVLFVAAPIYNHYTKDIIGVMANIIDTKNVSDAIRNLITKSIGDAYLIDQTGMIVFHTDKTLIGSRHSNSKIDLFFKNSNLSKANSFEFKDQLNKYYVAYINVTGTPWVLVIEQHMDIIMASANKALYVMIGTAIFVMTISIIVSVLFTRTLTRPLTELSKVVHQTTYGDLSVRSKYISNDEIGLLSKDLNHMLDELTGAYKEVESKNNALVITEEELRENYMQLEENQIELRKIQEKYALALEGSNDVVWEWEYNTNQFFASDAWFKLTGRPYYNKTISYVAFEELLNESTQMKVMATFQEHFKEHSEVISFNIELTLDDNTKKTLFAKASTQWDENGNPTKTSGILADITFEVETTNKIHDLAFLNQLTFIPNRLAYTTHLENHFRHAASQSHPLAIFQMDIDNFMRINDALGHEFGDAVLIALAKRLKGAETDQIKLYHLSADEFAFILTGFSDEDLIKNEIIRIYDLLNQAFQLDEKSLYISMSTGISLFPHDAQTVHKLIQNADTAMFTAKKSGKATYVFYTEFLSESVHYKLEIENILRRAIKDKLVFMHYQPQYNASSEQLNSFEALIRITTEEGISISPADFIPIAEENGSIIEFGDWVIEDTCKTIKELLISGYNFKHISINVSGLQLQQSDFETKLSTITQAYGIDPTFLELEVTESIFMNESDDQGILGVLRKKGYKIALDDFGTGYSSFAYLRKMPLSTLKIDKTFIDDLVDSKKDREVIRQMIQFSHELGIKVIAEGVETKEQLDILKNAHCDYIQGYYFSKPLSKEHIIKLLELF